jgi:hypothetical protein
MDNYTRDALSNCQTETERLNVLAMIRLEEKEKAMSQKHAIMNHRLYELGKSDASCHREISPDMLTHLKSDADYWQGFHDGRPDSLSKFHVSVIQDPTRPGGWCLID